MKRRNFYSRREMISQGLKKKKERETKASEIVENLTYNVTDRDTIRNSLNFITQAHYDDIVAERAIDGKCGYVICTNPLDKNISQKTQTHRICSKTNTVLELAERKKFCCELCYTHSNYLQGQILTSPLWLREENDKKVSYFFKDEHDIKLANVSVSSPTKIKSDEDKKPEEIIIDKPSKKEKPRRRHYPESKQENSSEAVFDVFKQWWTKDSSAYLNGNKLDNFKSNQECDKPQGTQTLPQSDSSMLECPRLKKMQAFYNGTTDIDTSSLLGAVKEINLDEKVQTILPRIDKTDQKSIRREIVLEGFQKA